MSNFSDDLKNKLKQKREGLEIDNNPSDFFSQFVSELKEEKERNPLLKLKENLKGIKESLTKEEFNLFQDIPEEPIQIVQESVITTPSEIVFEQPELKPDLVTLSVESITKDVIKNPVKESYTNFFSEPNPPQEKGLQALQNKVKMLEEWLGKISLAGPGSGEVNFRYLDDVNRSTIGNTDQILRYNPADKKFFFGQLSGDQGPVKSLQFDQNGPGITPVPGMISWNTQKDCLDVYQNDNTTLQVGLESYIRVYNNSGNTIQNGTIVQFGGVYSNQDVTPICVPMIADSSSVPLYIVGVLTEDIANNAYGRATVFGEVHDLDTTGTPVGETWNAGDLLWVSPSVAGGFTKTRPTAPNTVISVAAVLKRDSSNGIILVRPTIYQRSYYGSFYDTTLQSAALANTAYPIKINTTQIASGFHRANGSQIVAENAGLYNYQFSLQLASTNASLVNAYIWYRKNGQNVNNSTSVISLQSNKSNMVAAWNFIESMNVNDTFELMWAVDSTAITIANNIPLIDNAPSIPSVILTVTQVAL
jgi:hypothetical protein